MNKQILTYILFGACGVSIDYFVYIYLLDFFTIEISKILGFFAGALFNFFMNRKITFGALDKTFLRLLRFSFLYGFSLFLNVAVNTLIIKFMKDSVYAIDIAFLFATGTSIIVNFIGQKFWVFKK